MGLAKEGRYRKAIGSPPRPVLDARGRNNLRAVLKKGINNREPVVDGSLLDFFFSLVYNHNSDT
jgi:hypothetical protein